MAIDCPHSWYCRPVLAQSLSPVVPSLAPGDAPSSQPPTGEEGNSSRSVPASVSGHQSTVVERVLDTQGELLPAKDVPSVSVTSKPLLPTSVIPPSSGKFNDSVADTVLADLYVTDEESDDELASVHDDDDGDDDLGHSASIPESAPLAAALRKRKAPPLAGRSKARLSESGIFVPSCCPTRPSAPESVVKQSPACQQLPEATGKPLNNSDSAPG